MSEANSSKLVGYAALITAIGGFLSVFGISQIFPEVVKKLFNLDQTTSNNIQSITLSPAIDREIENYILSQGRSLTPENKTTVLNEAVEKYLNSLEQNSSSSQDTNTPTQSLPSAVSTSDAAPIGWNESPVSLGIYSKLDQDFSFICPPGGDIEYIAGTRVYTTNSSICTAAVHSGLINTRDGGQVKILIKGVQDSFSGTVNNQVESRRGGKRNESFTFIR